MAQRTARSRFLWLLNNTLNRVTSQIARSGRGPFSLIRHVGRKSGRTYETPVILAKAPEGFIAELTFGENVNWYRNVVAAGGCVVVHHRVEYRVTTIEWCSAERGRSAYPAPFRLVLKALGRNEFRLLRTDHYSHRPSTAGPTIRPLAAIGTGMQRTPRRRPCQPPRPGRPNDCFDLPQT